MTSYIALGRLSVLLAVTLVLPGNARAQRSAAGISTQGIFDAIGLSAGATVCEIGAGDGELTIAAAKVVGPRGRVLSSELGATRVKTLQESTNASGLAHITVVAGDTGTTNFPEAACDGLFMRDVYHHFSDPAAMNASILAALKPGGRVAIVDFTPPDEEATCPADRSKDGMHGVYAETVRRELRAAGFAPADSDVAGQRWFMVVATKPPLLNTIGCCVACGIRRHPSCSS